MNNVSFAQVQELIHLLVHVIKICTMTTVSVKTVPTNVTAVNPLQQIVKDVPKTELTLQPVIAQLITMMTVSTHNVQNVTVNVTPVTWLDV